MKYKTVELKKKLIKSNHIDDTISFKHKVNDEILDVEDAKVSGTFDYIKNEDTYIFNLHVTATVTSPCVISLKPTKVLVDFETELIYTFKVIDDDSILIVNNVIDLDEAIWSEIYLNMPLRVLSEGAEFQQNDAYIVKKENPFSKLLEEKGEE